MFLSLGRMTPQAANTEHHEGQQKIIHLIYVDVFITRYGVHYLMDFPLHLQYILTCMLKRGGLVNASLIAGMVSNSRYSNGMGN